MLYGCYALHCYQRKICGGCEG
uniref:Uncharacterized protein n=1 Tax=Anguilla anguilla TaxID=7936 RepID=A0A0E9XBU3_ANGAN